LPYCQTPIPCWHYEAIFFFSLSLFLQFLAPAEKKKNEKISSIVGGNLSRARYNIMMLVPFCALAKLKILQQNENFSQFREM
jgi:hypothetical protein